MMSRKILSSLIIFSLVLLFSPVDFVHHLVKNHDSELHLCDSETCIRTFEGHCELCDHVLPGYYFYNRPGDQAIAFNEIQSTFDRPLFRYSSHHLLPFNKAPPAS